VKLSACIIAQDEESRIRGCLESVGFADEVVVVDGGSRDRTAELARELGARVVTHPFDGHVEQKNRALGAAVHPWALCLDADERLSPELRAEIERLRREGPGDAAGFTFPRRTQYLGRWIRHGGWYPDRKLRLFRRDRGRWTGTNPHDRVEVDGPVRALSGDLLHFTYRDLSHHLRTVDAYTTIAAREKHRKGERFRRGALVFRPAGKFLRMYFLRAGFLDGLPGFLLAVTGAYYVFLKYAKLHELEKGSGPFSAAEKGPDPFSRP
jgi:glycosyltransferase involved in cell wall biosynthesis